MVTALTLALAALTILEGAYILHIHRNRSQAADADPEPRTVYECDGCKDRFQRHTQAVAHAKNEHGAPDTAAADYILTEVAL